MSYKDSEEYQAYLDLAFHETGDRRDEALRKLREMDEQHEAPSTRRRGSGNSGSSSGSSGRFPAFSEQEQARRDAETQEARKGSIDGTYGTAPRSMKPLQFEQGPSLFGNGVGPAPDITHLVQTEPEKEMDPYEVAAAIGNAAHLPDKMRLRPDKDGSYYPEDITGWASTYVERGVKGFRNGDHLPDEEIAGGTRFKSIVKGFANIGARLAGKSNGANGMGRFDGNQETSRTPDFIEVCSHTRHLANGKTITVKEHTRKSAKQ